MCWAEHEGWQHTLLVRRNLEAEPEYAFYFTYAPQKKSTLKTLVAIAGRRWAVEIAFQMAKGECGLDHYEVRHWQDWYRHITLAMLALAVLTVLHTGEKKTFPQEGFSQRTRNPASACLVAVVRLAKTAPISRTVLPLPKTRLPASCHLVTTVVQQAYGQRPSRFLLRRWWGARARALLGRCGRRP